MSGSSDTKLHAHVLNSNVRATMGGGNLSSEQYTSPILPLSVGGMTQENLKEMLHGLTESIEGILYDKNVEYSFLEIYHVIYTFVNCDLGEVVYKAIVNRIDAFAKDLSSQVRTVAPNEIVSYVLNLWQQYMHRTESLDRVCQFLNNSFCTPHLIPTILAYSLLRWRDCVLGSEHVSGALSNHLRSLVHDDRERGNADMGQVREAVAMLVHVSPVDLLVYRRDFEQLFITDARDYYAAQREKRLASSDGLAAYAAYASQAIEAELVRARAYLDSVTLPALRSVVVDALVGQAIGTLVDGPGGLTALIRSKDVTSSASVWSLVLPFRQHVAHLRAGVRAAARLEVARACDAPMGPRASAWMEKVVTAYCTVKQTVARATDRHGDALQETAFGAQAAVAGVAAIPTAIVAYLDALLRAVQDSMSDMSTRKGPRHPGYASIAFMGDDEDGHARGPVSVPSDEPDGARACVLATLELLRGVAERDMFEEHYRDALAQRLLTGSSSLVMERRLVALLRTDAGPQLTTTLEAMLHDMGANERLAKKLNSRQHARGGPLCAPLIVTKHFWQLPREPGLDALILPETLRDCLVAAEQAYLQQHDGRKVEWIQASGVATVKCDFACGQRELVVTTMQYLVLRCFQDHDAMTFAEMCAATGVPAELLARQALSLAHPKVGILKKTPNSPACEADHVFAYNNAFNSTAYKVRVPLIASSSLPKPAGDSNTNAQAPTPAVSHKLMAQRKTAIDAALLRVMKRRKEVEHGELVKEVAEVLASVFPVDAAAVKLRIEGLIDQDYMERAENERSLYRYIA